MPGHFLDSFELAEDSKTYDCCICLGIVRDAIAHECGILFCSDCWSKTTEDGHKACPVCTRTGSEYGPDFRARREVLNLPLTCSKCSQTTRLENRDVHEKACVFSTRSYLGTNLSDVTASIRQPKLPFSSSVQESLMQVHPGFHMDLPAFLVMEDILNDVFARLTTAAMSLDPPSLISRIGLDGGPKECTFTLEAISIVGERFAGNELCLSILTAKDEGSLDSTSWCLRSQAKESLAGKLAAWEMKVPLEKKQAFDSWLHAVRQKRDDGSWFPGGMLESAHFEYAANSVFPGELGEHGVSEGVKAVDKYEIANNLKSSASKRRKIDFGPISSTLPVLSVDLVGAMLIRQTGRIVNRKAAVYFTGLILYIAAEVLDVAGNEAKDCKADIISPRHITLAIRGDEDLDTMFPGLILGGGLMPHIHKISALPMDELLKGSDEDKAASHREFVSFDAGEERGMVATNLFAKHFHGEGEHPRGISADSQGLPRKTVGQAEEKAPSISDRLLRLVAAKAGVVRIGKCVFDVLRSCALKFLTTKAKAAILRCRFDRSLCVTVQHVLQSEGPLLYGTGRLGLHDNARFKYEAHQFQEELFVPEEARLGANADFEAGSPLFFFCESKAAYDKVLAKQGPRCGAAECQKFSIFAESWCQEHKAEMESKELEERTKEAVMLRGEDGDMPVTEATMHAASLALIRKMQSSVESVLPFKVVAALVVRLGVEFQNDLQFEPAAICILAKLLECYLVGLLEDSLLSSIRGLRRCVIAEDVTLAKRMRGGRTTS